MNSNKMDGSFDDTSVVCDQKTKAAKCTTDQQTNVYIWDMDETLILLKSLLNGTYAVGFNGLKDIEKGMEIGKCWEKYILQVCDEFFLYEQVENYNEPYLVALNTYDDGQDLSTYDFSNDDFSDPRDDSNKRKLAYRLRVIAQKYAQGLHSSLDQEMIKLWDDLYSSTDIYTDRWLSSARNLLEQTSQGNKVITRVDSTSGATNSSNMRCQNINVLVTSGSLIPSLVKCLLFRLDDLFVHENVYSSWDVGKLQCFSWIKERFAGPATRFCVIGDGFEECEAAEKMRWPFIRIDPRPNGSHRFPGLTMKTINHYIDVVYGVPDSENDDES